MTDSQASRRQYSEAVYSFAAEQLQNSQSSLHVQSMLVEKGLDEESAADVVSQLSEAHAHSVDSIRMAKMILGAVICIGGILVTVCTFVAAETSGGDSYVIAWGAIISGGIVFVRALWRE